MKPIAFAVLTISAIPALITAGTSESFLTFADYASLFAGFLLANFLNEFSFFEKLDEK